MLVVDDESRNRKLLEGYLRSEGYQVRGAADGRTAVSLAKEELPEVILLDVMMPEITGHEVCRILKADPKTRICQVMMITALASTSNKVEGLDVGADDYVTKPVRREEFLAKVRALVRVARLLRDLESARSTLAARNEELKLKKTLAQTLVHDLKSPLSAILGNLDLLSMSADDRLQRMIERSRMSASRILSMIVNLLDVEKLEEGRLVPRIQRIDLGEMARAGVDEARVVAGQRRVHLALDAPGEAVWTDIDPGLVRRVLDNLMSNAIAHSPGGGEVRIEVGSRPEGVELSVSDQGDGVPHALREEIFEKYAQLDDHDAGRSLNRGLGLTFCRLAVEAHGGSIWVDDAVGGGARFRVLLADAVAPAAGEPDLAVVSREE